MWKFTKNFGVVDYSKRNKCSEVCRVGYKPIQILWHIKCISDMMFLWKIRSIMTLSGMVEVPQYKLKLEGESKTALTYFFPLKS